MIFSSGKGRHLLNPQDITLPLEGKALKQVPLSIHHVKAITDFFRHVEADLV
jgi:hypothetical protein